MRPPLTSALALLLLGAIAVTPVRGVSLSPRVETAESPTESESVTDQTGDPATPRHPDTEEGQPGRFDNLWLVVVGVVGLLVVVQLVRIELSGRGPSKGAGSGNESGSSGVFSDE
jgi:hypothetical protein